MKTLLVLVSLLCISSSVIADTSKTTTTATQAYPFTNPAQAKTFNKLLVNLRCLVCQNENLADSQASLATDLRQEVYKQVRQGKTEEQVIHFMVARYGDFILFKPPVQKNTYLLWFLPFLLLFLVILIFIIKVWRAKAGRTKELSIKEKEKLQELLKK